MAKTDLAELERRFEQIPPCVHPEDTAFADALRAMLSEIAATENDSHPEHNYLIGLAYLDGIDVEVDAERGVALITSAAENGLPEAMERLFYMYREGYKVARNYRMALEWAERLSALYTEKYVREHPHTLTVLQNLAVTYGDLGENKRALQIQEGVYASRRKILGEAHPDTLMTLNNLAVLYKQLGDGEKFLELKEEIRAIKRRNAEGGSTVG